MDTSDDSRACGAAYSNSFMQIILMFVCNIVGSRMDIPRPTSCGLLDKIIFSRSKACPSKYGNLADITMLESHLHLRTATNTVTTTTNTATTTATTTTPTRSTLTGSFFDPNTWEWVTALLSEHLLGETLIVGGDKETRLTAVVNVCNCVDQWAVIFHFQRILKVALPKERVEQPSCDYLLATLFVMLEAAYQHKLDDPSSSLSPSFFEHEHKACSDGEDGDNNDGEGDSDQLLYVTPSQQLHTGQRRALAMLLLGLTRSGMVRERFEDLGWRIDVLKAPTVT